MSDRDQLADLGADLVQSGAEDTGSFEKIEHVARIETSRGSDPVVYGLGMKKPDYKADHDRRVAVGWIIGAVVVVLALLAFLFVAQPFSWGGTGKAAKTEAPAPEEQAAAADDEAGAEEATAADGGGQQPEAPQTLNVEQLGQTAHALGFAGEDLQLADAALSVEASAGHVLVYQDLGDVAGTEAGLLAGRTAQCAAALANQLRNAQTEDGAAIATATWVTRNGIGEAYLAVSFAAGAAPNEGAGMDVLAQAPSYLLSEGLYDALGQTVAQAAGEVPTTPAGEGIWPTADLL